MMASLSEPKLILPDTTITINKTIDSLCDSACDPEENYTGSCPSPCISECPKYCQYPVPIPEPTISVDVNMNHHHKASSLLIAMLSLVGATLLVICLYFAYVKIQNSRRRRRQPRVIQTHEDDGDFFDAESQGDVVDHPIWYIRTVGLQPSVINSIMVFKYKRGDGLIEGSTDCSVCLTEFEEDETLRLLPKCSHAFHVPCIDTWLRSHTNCPMCRAPIVGNSSSRVRTVEQDNGSANPTGGEEGIMDESSEESDVDSRERELRMGIVGDEELGTGDERKRNEVEEIQPVRRSVSLDSLAASKISLAFLNVRQVQSGKNSDSQIGKFNGNSLRVHLRRVGSSSGRSLQNRPSYIRSLSLGGQRLQSVYSRSQSSVLPL